MYNKPKISRIIVTKMVNGICLVLRDQTSLKSCSLKTEYYKHDLSVKVEL